MAYKEKEIEKLYYSIGEVAEMFNVAPSLIRFWESEFEVIQPKKNRKGTEGISDKSMRLQAEKLLDLFNWKPWSKTSYSSHSLYTTSLDSIYYFSTIFK